MTIKQTAEAFNFPEFAIRTLVKQGRFPVVKVGTRVYIIRSTFEDYLKSGGERYDAKRS
ncbi:MAG: helix-turn-helix domain-containing protein [Clostridiales bacterium]|jgi:excisionase family DNA binding protein|nr:helix-turn-helix domain-containing protein [Clostridiales bacterium]